MISDRTVPSVLTALWMLVAATAAPSQTPQLISLNPTGVESFGPSFTLTVTGTNFTPQTIVEFAPPNPLAPGVALAVLSQTPTQIEVTVPASLINQPFAQSPLILARDPGQPSGIFGGASYLTFDVALPEPTISSITPAVVPVGSATTTVTVVGTGFHSAGSALQNGAPVGFFLPTVIGSTQFTTTVDASLLANSGTVEVGYETNPIGNYSVSGSSSAAANLFVVNPAPVVTSVSPGSFPEGSGAGSITLTGMGFNGESEVLWDATPLAVTALSPTAITATVPASLLAVVPTAAPRVRVRNPVATSGSTTMGGGDSESFVICIEPAGVIYNGHRYVTTPTPQFLSVGEMREWAAQQGGYLVSINDAAEQAFLLANFVGAFLPPYIGLSDARDEGVFRWEDGSPVGYTNWAPGEPNAGPFDEDFVVLAPGTGQWESAGDGLPFGRAIIEIPLTSAAPPHEVMITEVSWGSPDALEITNFGATPVDVSQWTVTWVHGTQSFTSSPLGFTIQPGEIVTLGEAAGPLPPVVGAGRVFNVFNVLNGNVDGLVVSLFDAAGANVDEVVISDQFGQDQDLPRSGTFRGLVVRTGLSPLFGEAGAERIQGLDTDSASDWTEQANRSLGLRNLSNGVRSSDPLPMPSVRINEFDDDHLELINFGSETVDLQGWSLSTSAFGATASREFPFACSTPLAAGGLLVVGDASPPAELPAGAPWFPTSPGWDPVNVISGGELAVRDRFGRVVDMVRAGGLFSRTVRSDQGVAAHWSEFRGVADPLTIEGSLGRTGTNHGDPRDYRKFAVRTMGAPNGVSLNPPGNPASASFVVEPAQAGLGSVTIFLNAGPARAGLPYGQLFSAAPSAGFGPFLGLGADALTNLFAFANTAPFFGTLDARGTMRYDLPAGFVPYPVDMVMYIGGAGSLEFTEVHAYVP